MENTEVMNVEEIEVIEPIVTEVADVANDKSVSTLGSFVMGSIAVAGAMALWKFAIKPGAKKLMAKIEEKKLARNLHEVRTNEESNVTTVDFEEVDISDNK